MDAMTDPPATKLRILCVDDEGPILKALAVNLRARDYDVDLASTGEEALQPGNLEGSAMRSWIGLYALLRMIRDAKMTEFSREGITKMLNAAKDVPMLDMFGGEDWTPALNHPGVFKRAGINTWASWKWDPKAKAPDGLKGNFVKASTINFDKVMCGSPLGAPADTC